MTDGATQAYSAANELCWSAPTTGGGCAAPPAGATTYGYDTRGKRTSRTPPPGAPGAATYGYDQANRLTTAPGATYRYRGDGLRLAKTVGGVTTTFNWDESGPLPLLLSETTNGATTRDIYDDKGLPLEQVGPDGVLTFMHHDQLGSVRMLTQNGANVMGTFTYDAYGRQAASTGSVSQPFGFGGEYTDAETGFQYLRARYYDPATGNFLTRDPRLAVSGQPYSYANNSPHNFTDPTGEIAWLVLAVVAIEVGLAVADAVSTAKTFADPCASALDKLVSGGLFAMGVGLPGGAYSTAADKVGDAGRRVWSITGAGTARALRHDRFGTFSKSHSDGSWWVRDRAGHGGSVWKVYEETSTGLRWRADADKYGDFISGKHKGPVGQFIPWKELTGQ